jgi:hypothetical protein
MNFKNMTDQQVIELIEKEFKEKTLGVTKQFLDIHSPIYFENKIRIDRIDRDSKFHDGEDMIIAYLPVFDEKFYFSVFINPKENEVTGINTEPWIRVYFRATSETLSIDELKSMTKLNPTEFWNKGDIRTHGKSTHTFSSFKILPNPEPDTFENKLKKLLDFLEQDRDGIKRLVDKAFGGINVAIDFHNGNGMIGGAYLAESNIKRMSNLGLSIDFDLYVGGNVFKD